MPLTTGFETPSWATLVARVEADFTTRLAEDVYIPRSWLWGLVRVVAGVSYAVHGVAAFVARQAIADRSDEAGVVRHSEVFAVGQIPGTRGSGIFLLGGTAGTPVPLGTLFRRTSDGVEWATDVVGTIGAPAFTAVTVQPGSFAPLAADTYVLTTPITGINSAVTHFATPTDGTDIEPVEDMRSRFIDRLRYPPHGGAAHDYMRWARESLETVDAVWVVKGAVSAGPPLAIDVPVTVYFTVEGTGVAVIPTAGNVTTVDAYLEPRAPEGAAPAATAPAGVVLNLTIVPTDPWDTAANRTAVEAALAALLARKNRERQRDIYGAVSAVGTVTVYNSEIRTTIGSIMEMFTITTINGDGTGLSNLALTAAQAGYLGTVTWV